MKKLITIFKTIKNKSMKRNKNFKIGDIVKPTKNGNSHNYTIGEHYRVITVSDGSSNPALGCETLDGEWQGNTLMGCDCILVNRDKSHYLKIITELETEIEEVKSILSWMDETGNTTYDENEHKVWEALTLLEDETLTKVQKAKIIAQLINR
jgi:hypothetical protein